jgi:hydrogenase/urease accessory protein HupE
MADSRLMLPCHARQPGPSAARAAAIFAAFLMCLLPSFAHAHPEGFSGLHLRVQGDSATAVLTLHTRDMSNWFPPGKFPDYVTDVSAALAKSPDQLLELRADANVVEPGAVRVSSPEVGMIQVEVNYAIGAGRAALEVWSKHLARLPRGHQQLFFAIDVRRGPTGHAVETTLLEETLSTDNDSVTIELPLSPTDAGHPATTTTTPAPPTAPATRRISFFALGVEHIVTGYDHLLFLAALLLVCHNFREAAGVITFFTLAHSITLSLAALNIVRLPAQIVEPAIAASIVYVGLENIFGRHRFVWRAAVTFAFGLVHGLGFASALREVGLGSTPGGVALPLLKFSLGLEAGQLCIAAVLLKVLLWLRKRERFERYWVPAGSVLVSVIGAYWLVSRLLAG